MDSEVILRKVLPSGEEITLSKILEERILYNASCWTSEGDDAECRWSLDFQTQAEAQHEYDRWN